jgi:hypothetical protein
MDKRHNPPKPPCPHCGWAMPKGALTSHIRSKHGGQDVLAERFWAKVDKSPHPLGCWIWTACRSTVTKYGTFNWRGTNINAHRAAWLLTNGPIDGEGIDVLHTCANGIGGCVNPSHLYLGTDKENSRDRVIQGGSKFVTPEQVRRVRQLLAERPWRRGMNTEIAKIVGVKPIVVCNIKRGKNWWHIA